LGAFQTPWALPPVGPLTAAWDPKIDAATKINVIAYVGATQGYTAVAQPDWLEISCGPCFWEFYRQDLFATGLSSLPANLGIPASYSSWVPTVNFPHEFVLRKIAELQAIQRADDSPSFASVRRAVSSIFLASGAGGLQATAPTVLTELFRLFPGACIDFVSVSNDEQHLSAIVRSLAKQEALGIDLTRAALNAGWTGRRTRESRYFDVLVNLFGADIAGFTAPWLDRTLLVTFQSPQPISDPAFEIAYARGLDMMGQPDYGAPHPGRTFRSLTFSEMRVFTHWYILALNKTLSFLLHIGTFSKAGVIRPLLSYKHILTWEQITLLVAKTLASGDLAIKKRLALGLIDILVGARGMSVEEFFSPKRINKLIDSLAGLPPSIQTEFSDYARSVFAELVDEICDGVIPTAINGGFIDLPSGRLTKEQFAAKNLHALRNTIHSYAGHQGNDYAQYLLVSDDELPNTLPALVPILFLSVLAKPSLHFNSGVFGGVF
jgi:hypothetical protein